MNMHSYRKLVEDAIMSVPPLPFAEHGLIVTFADIFEYCRDRGNDNHEIIKSVLQKMHENGEIEAVYTKEEILIGARH